MAKEQTEQREPDEAEGTPTAAPESRDEQPAARKPVEPPPRVGGRFGKRPDPTIEPTPAPAPVAPQAAQAPSMLDDGHASPGAVRIAPSAMRIPPRPKLTEYHVGTRSGCPHQNVTVAGIAFPQFTGGALIGQDKVKGARVRLSEAQVDALKKALATKVVRWTTGELRRGQMLSTESMGFVAEVGDEPLAAYLYCYPVPEAQKQAEAREPASMLG